MKNITLLTFLFLFSHLGFSQLDENFDTAPSAPVGGGVWALASGDWMIFDNGVGSVNWQLNTGPFPAYSTPNAAFITNQNVGAGNTSVDYLATPLVPMPTNAQLRFMTRTTSAGDQGTIYQIRAAPSTADPSLISSYSTLVVEYDEADLTHPTNITTYIEKVVSIPASVGPSAYIAFVKIFTHPAGPLTGDRWLVDDVLIVSECFTPTGLNAGGITQTSANLSWNALGATEWQIEILPTLGTFTGNGVTITSNPFTATAITTGGAFGAAFAPSTEYKYRVRAVCGDGITSEWSDVYDFETSSPGLSCAAPIVFTTPYSTTDNTANYGDTTDTAQPATCAGTAANYMTGNDVFYSYTPTESGAISIAMTPTGTWSGIFVYQGCANVGVSCLAGVANSGNTIREIPSLNVTAGQEYIIVISTNATPQTVAYNLVVQTLNCASPTGLSATGTGPTSANLSWDANGATSWEVAVQTAGSAVPTGAGTTTATNVNYPVTQTLAGAPLALGTPYQYWVRSDCGDGTFSTWSGPYLFNTTSCAVGCNYTFVMTDSWGDGWNGNTMSVIQDGLTIATIGPTFTTGTGPVTVSVPLCDGPFQLFWNAGGSFGNEIGVSIVNSFGQTIFVKPSNTGSANSLLFSGTVDCNNPPCLPPNNLTVTAPTTNGATLNWTPNGPTPVSWEIYAVATGSPAPTAATVPTVTIPGTTTLPYTITGLLADTQYTYYVRAVCTGPGVNDWSAPSPNFTTLPTCPKPTMLFATAVTQNSATFSWMAGSTETAWEIIITDPTAPVPAADDPNWQSATNPVTINTLTPGTSYVFYVRAVCSPTDSSTPAGPVAVNTLQVPGTLPYTEDFENNPQLTISNGTQANKWIIGTAVSNGGTHSLYITNDNGASNSYSNTTTVVHAYRDIQMPAVVDELNLSFDWRAMAESCCDYIRVWMVPVTFSPTPGTLITAGNSGGVQIGANFNQQGTWQTVNYVVQGAAFANQTMRLVFEWRNDGSVGNQPPGAIDNIVLNQITCSAPSNLGINNVTETTANVTWTGPTAGAESFDFYYSTTNTAPGDTTTPNGNVVNPSTPLSGLTPSTTYYFWVRSNCGTDGTSTWTGPISITTTQIPAVLNFEEDFEGTNGWSYVGTQTNKWIVGSAVSNGGTQSLYITNNNGVSNAFTVTSASVAHAYRDIQMPAAIDDLNLAFDWRAVGESCCDYMRVWMVPSSFTPVAGTQITAGASGGVQLGANFNQSATWQTENFVIPAAAYAGQTMRIVFEWRNDGSVGTQPPAAVDNVNLTIITCSAPSALTLDDVSQSTADVSWTGPNSGAESFDYYYSTVNTAPGSTATPSGNVPDPNVALTGLNPSTTYYFWVRSNCGADGTSTWTGPILITTTQIPGVLDYEDDFEGPNGWSYVGTQTNKWIVGTAVSNGGTHSLYITNNNGTSNAYTTSAISIAHAYRDIQMPATVGELSFSFDWRAIGEGFTTTNWDYFRVWLVPATYTPVAGAQIVGGGNRIQVNGNYNNSNTWQTENHIIQSSAFAGSVMRVVFEWRNDGGGGTQPPAAIDNVSLVALTCPSPIELTASNTSTLNELELTWTPTGTETQWEIVVQIAGSGAPVSGTIVTGTPTFTYTAIPGTFYEFFVRAICSPDDMSFWSGPQPFSIFSPPGCASVDLVGVGVDIVDAEIFLCAGESQCVELSASFYGIGATTSYAIEAIDYDPPFPFTGGIEMPIEYDDDYTPTFDLPFNFCFFGESYDSCKIGDNGVIVFGLPYSTEVTPAPYTINGPIPNTTFSVKNAIYGIFQDLDVTNNPSSNTSINYQVLGTYPCRALVVNFNEVPLWDSDCTDPQYRMTTQIVLYEISNIIEVYVQNRTSCADNWGGVGVLGIQNAAGTVAYTPPGRNTGTWNATNEAWRFSPDGASNVEFEWIKDGEFYSSDQDIQVCITQDTHMVAQATYIACDGTEVVTSSEVMINTTSPLPTADPVTIVSCSATGNPVFDFTPNSTLILSSVTDPNITVTYYLTEADATAATNPIADATAFSGACDQIVYVRIAYGNTQCFEVKSFELECGVTAPAVTTFFYASPFCGSDTASPLPEPAPGFTLGGIYSSGDVTVNPATGAIDLSTSPAGTFDVTYTVAPNGCNEGGTFTTSITIEAAAVADVLPNVTACGGFELPALATGNVYYAGPGATGGTYPVGYVVTGTQPVYIYATNGSCTDESSFTVTINPAPQIDPIAPVFACDSYNLPSLAEGEYYTASGGPAGGGTIVPQNSDITTVGLTTLYAYAEIITDTDVCFVEQVVEITISTTPDVMPVADVQGCGSFELPAIIGDGAYYAQSGGQGATYVAGDILTASQTVYVYAQSPTNSSCVDEESFEVSISQTPDFMITGECENNVFTLRANVVDNSFDLGNATYSWTVTGDGQILSGINDSAAQVSGSGTYTLTVSTAGCSDVVRSYTPPATGCTIQKGISPNGDGMNDCFMLEAFNVDRLSIFNRYGVKVYELGNYVDEWCGQSDSGDDLPNGTYYYMIERAGESAATGWIYILREN